MATALCLSDLQILSEITTIENAYGLLGHDYQREVSGTLSGQVLDAPASVAWLRPPTHDEVKRLFNQLNMSYAERWALESPSEDPIRVIHQCNSIMLYRQKKAIGLRCNEIGYGARTELDFLDPRRAYKRLVGLTPHLLVEALESWRDALAGPLRTGQMALFLSLALIAIHPFVDGNGRTARLIYSWLRKRWGLRVLWLAEAHDGELFRTGHRLESTEFLMGRFMLDLCGGYNAFQIGHLGPIGPNEARRSFETLIAHFDQIRTGSGNILELSSFCDLRNHLQAAQHFRDSSPRFESLRGVIAP